MVDDPPSNAPTHESEQIEGRSGLDDGAKVNLIQQDQPSEDIAFLSAAEHDTDQPTEQGEPAMQQQGDGLRSEDVSAIDAKDDETASFNTLAHLGIPTANGDGTPASTRLNEIPQPERELPIPDQTEPFSEAEQPQLHEQHPASDLPNEQPSAAAATTEDVPTIPEQAAPEAGFEENQERAPSPGEQLFDRIAHPGIKKTVSWVDTPSSDWLAGSSTSEQAANQQIDDMVARETEPLIADNDRAEEEDPVHENGLDVDAQEPFAQAEPDMAWMMNSEINDEVPSQFENHSLEDVQTFADDEEDTPHQASRASISEAFDFPPTDDGPPEAYADQGEVDGDDTEGDSFFAQLSASREPDAGWMEDHDINEEPSSAKAEPGSDWTEQPGRNDAQAFATAEPELGWMNDHEVNEASVATKFDPGMDWMADAEINDKQMSAKAAPDMRWMAEPDVHDAILEPESQFFAENEADDMHETPHDAAADVLNESHMEGSEEVQQSDEIEDSWAQAFDSGDLNEDSWDKAFADEMDDGLDDASVPQSMDDSTSRYAPQSTSASAPAYQYSQQQPPRSMYPSFAPAAPVQPSPTPPQQERAKPMEFFAELPAAPLRSRKAQRPAMSQPQQATPPPPSFTPPVGHRPPSSSSTLQTLAGPGRLELFPPQPSVPPPQHPSNAAYSLPPQMQQATPPPTSRYSPAPVPQQPPQSFQNLYNPASPPTSTSNIATPPAGQVPVHPPIYSGSPQVFVQDATQRGRNTYTPSTGQNAKRPSPYAAPPSSSGVPTQSSQYSPAQSSAQLAPPSASAGTPRYSPARQQENGSQPPAMSTRPALQEMFEPLPPPPPHRFAPRTSSPLAQPNQLRPQPTRNVTMPMPAPAQNPPPVPSHAKHQSHGDEAMNNVPLTSQRSAPSQVPNRYTPPLASQDSASHQSQQPPIMPPVVRPRTSSPLQNRTLPPTAQAPVERAASTHIAAPPSSGFSASARISGHGPGQASSLEFVPPMDETAQDPLERWKGCPIFRWGPHGSILTCAPKQIPRYGGGQSAPKLKCLAGEPKLRKTKDVLPDDCHLGSFPGPLRSKSKKKEVVVWMQGMVEAMEQTQSGFESLGHDHSRAEERVLLWKCVKVFIEHDGILAGNATVDTAVRLVLTAPEEDVEVDVNETAAVTAPSEAQEPRHVVVKELKQLLLQGEREKAVWVAVDRRLWSHAMLISSTLNKDIWKQVVQEFVRKDVRSPEDPNHSLAALYEVFAGDWEDSIDQLVPVSARSGFQMVSTADRGSQPRDAMEGLRKWRETLVLILNNRSAGDENALLALGKLLASYGRTEAAHTCFLFARSIAQFGGADEPQTNFALLGFDHLSPDTVVNLDSILLTEVYEFGLTLASPAALNNPPHLQAYKLRHAYAAAEFGQHTEALSYCDVIASAVTSKTKVSPYYHGALLSQLDELQKRLSQSPKDASSSWMKAKPTMGKVSSSMSKWFNTFVEGEDDAASSGSGNHSETEAGPFTRNLGGTPSLSRSASHSDFFGAEFARSGMSAGQPMPGQSNSKYAPMTYGARQSTEQDQAGPLSPYSASPESRYMGYSPRVSSDGQAQPYASPPQATVSSFQRQPSFQPNGTPVMAQGSFPSIKEETHETYPAPTQPDSSQINGYGQANGYAPSIVGYEPTSQSYEPTAPIEQPSYSYEPWSGGHEQHAPSSEQMHSASYEPQKSSYEPTQASNNQSTSSSYESPSYGYNPNDGGYAPPTYDPSASDPSQVDEISQPRRRQFGDEDEDDDILNRAAALKSSSTSSSSADKAAKDRQVEDAFRKAAEADAARDKAAQGRRASSGWFRGINLNPFGGGGAKKDDKAPTVHRAKLGEENSFYYDEQAKRWVNKNATTTPEPVSATPPPPRAGPPMGGGSAPPSRAVSASGGPPTPMMGGPPISRPPTGVPSTILEGSAGPPSRMGTPGSTYMGDAPEDGNVSTPPPGMPAVPPIPGPPSRPSTGMGSMSNDLDGLLGAANSRKGGTIKKGKKGGANRYVDVFPTGAAAK